MGRWGGLQHLRAIDANGIVGDVYYFIVLTKNAHQPKAAEVGDSWQLLNFDISPEVPWITHDCHRSAGDSLVWVITGNCNRSLTSTSTTNHKLWTTREPQDRDHMTRPSVRGIRNRSLITGSVA